MWAKWLRRTRSHAEDSHVQGSVIGPVCESGARNADVHTCCQGHEDGPVRGTEDTSGSRMRTTQALNPTVRCPISADVEEPLNG